MMRKYFAAMVYLWIIIIGCFMIGWTKDGPVIICITCGPTLSTIIGIVSIAIGVAGLGLVATGKSAIGR